MVESTGKNKQHQRAVTQLQQSNVHVDGAPRRGNRKKRWKK